MWSRKLFETEWMQEETDQQQKLVETAPDWMCTSNMALV